MLQAGKQLTDLIFFSANSSDVDVSWTRYTYEKPPYIWSAIASRSREDGSDFTKQAQHAETATVDLQLRRARETAQAAR